MPSEINFLSKRRKALTQVQTRDRRLAFLAGYGLVGVSGVLLAIVVIGFFFTTRVNAVKKEQKAVELSIDQQKSVETEYLLLAEKIGAIQTLLEGKNKKQEAIEHFSNLFVQQRSTLLELSYSQDGLIVFQISAANIFDFNALLVTLRSPQLRQKYPSISVTDLARVKTVIYTVAVTIQIDKDTAKKKPVEPEPEGTILQ